MGLFGFGKKNKSDTLTEEQKQDLLKRKQKDFGEKLLVACQKAIKDKKMQGKYELVVVKLDDNAGKYSIYIGAEDEKSVSHGAPEIRGHPILQLNVYLDEEDNLTIRMTEGPNEANAKYYGENDFEAVADIMRKKVVDVSK